MLLLLIPQRYKFSSKSQQATTHSYIWLGCCWYHKGTNFQANHNARVYLMRVRLLLLIPQRYKFSSKSQPKKNVIHNSNSCCWYHKGTNFQANHNARVYLMRVRFVVADTTKVQIFKQITTCRSWRTLLTMLLLIPQRYKFSSKSQHPAPTDTKLVGCCWYHKGTNFQANHNQNNRYYLLQWVVADTTKVQIFKQITTLSFNTGQIPCCCWYHKGTNFQANHNRWRRARTWTLVVADTTKVQIFKQITTGRLKDACSYGCCWYHKGTNFQANHN